MNADLRIVDVKAYPTSFPVPAEHRVSLGIGTAIKRDAVVVKVTTAGGLTGHNPPASKNSMSNTQQTVAITSRTSLA